MYLSHRMRTASPMDCGRMLSHDFQRMQQGTAAWAYVHGMGRVQAAYRGTMVMVSKVITVVMGLLSFTVGIRSLQLHSIPQG